MDGNLAIKRLNLWLNRKVILTHVTTWAKLGSHYAL
jgi:hypothetical protein